MTEEKKNYVCNLFCNLFFMGLAKGFFVGQFLEFRHEPIDFFEASSHSLEPVAKIAHFGFFEVRASGHFAIEMADKEWVAPSAKFVRNFFASFVLGETQNFSSVRRV